LSAFVKILTLFSTKTYTDYRLQLVVGGCVCLQEAGTHQGCPMVCFQTKNPNLGKFWRVLQWKMLVYFMDTWSILRYFVIFYGHLV
jgi:hypothetical protein